jgi:CMP-N,N'-diacetyllegionaminic acid synthase
MNIISIIPARGGSKEIPFKNIVKINGKPLLYYTVKASLNSSLVTRTIVSTDNEEIEKIARKMNAEVIKRPKIISNDSSQLEPVISHVLKFLKRKENYSPDIIVLLQNTSPLRNSIHVQEAIKLLLAKKYDSVLSGFRSHRFIWKSKGKTVFPINYDPKKRPRRQEMAKEFIENGAIYITKTKCFNKSNCRISGKIGLYEISENLSLEIDSKFDLELVNHILQDKKIEKN